AHGRNRMAAPRPDWSPRRRHPHRPPTAGRVMERSVRLVSAPRPADRYAGPGDGRRECPSRGPAGTAQGAGPEPDARPLSRIRTPPRRRRGPLRLPHRPFDAWPGHHQDRVQSGLGAGDNPAPPRSDPAGAAEAIGYDSSESLRKLGLRPLLEDLVDVDVDLLVVEGDKASDLLRFGKRAVVAPDGVLV